MESKRGQVTIFVIIAVVVIAAVVLILLLREPSVPVSSQLPAELQSPYSAFLACLDTHTKAGIRILESQGGYIDVPDFEPGTSYMPFSNQLDFLGTPVPYWYYVSGNNIAKEQVPTVGVMEDQLARFIESKADECNLQNFYDEGYLVSFGVPRAEVSIKSEEVQVIVDMDVSIEKDIESEIISEHRFSVDSSLGKLYSTALIIYEKEQEELFLENYGVDVLNLYAPVNGVELTCSPLIWDAEEVFDEVAEGIEANTQAIKTKGDSNNYFYIDVGVESNVRFLNSRNWSSAYEVNPTDGQLLMSMPVGNQPGLGLMGFCYVPYHYIYNIKYPVLVQVYEGNEVFQFPIAVVILGNLPREPITASAVENQILDFCEYKNTQMSVDVFDSKGIPIEADISYDCSGTTCYIGKTTNGKMSALFPQCANGKVIARARNEGFVETQISSSTTRSGPIIIEMIREYPLNVELTIDRIAYDGEAIISFSSDDYSRTIVYPGQKSIELVPGEYEVLVYVYDDSNLEFAEEITEQCVEVPKGGIGGLIGLTEERCFDIEMPEQIITKALSAGGKAKKILLDSTLRSASGVFIDAESLPEPDSLEQLQTNYIIFEDKILEVDFR